MLAGNNMPQPGTKQSSTTSRLPAHRRGAQGAQGAKPETLREVISLQTFDGEQLEMQAKVVRPHYKFKGGWRAMGVILTSRLIKLPLSKNQLRVALWLPMISRPGNLVTASGARVEAELNIDRHVFSRILTALEQMQTEDGIAAALQLLQIAKKYVDGVGGESKIAVLHNDGRVRQKPGWEVKSEESILEDHSKLANKLMLAMMRTRTDSDSRWKAILDEFVEEITQLRGKKKESDQRIENLWQLLREHQAKEEEQKEREASKKLPYLLPIPAKNLYTIENNVFSGPSLSNATPLGKLTVNDGHRETPDG
jgi:hypothetical protein